MPATGCCHHVHLCLLHLFCLACMLIINGHQHTPPVKETVPGAAICTTLNIFLVT